MPKINFCRKNYVVVIVLGFTDNVPVAAQHQAQFPSNWEVAGARAEPTHRRTHPADRHGIAGNLPVNACDQAGIRNRKLPAPLAWRKLVCVHEDNQVQAAHGSFSCPFACAFLQQSSPL